MKPKDQCSIKATHPLAWQSLFFFIWSSNRLDSQISCCRNTDRVLCVVVETCQVGSLNQSRASLNTSTPTHIVLVNIVLDVVQWTQFFFFAPLCSSRWCHLVCWFVRQCQPESWQPFKWIPDPVALLPLAAFIPRGCLLSGDWGPEAERGTRGRNSFPANGLPVSWSKQCSRFANNDGIIGNLQSSHSGQETLWLHWHIHQ